MKATEGTGFVSSTYLSRSRELQNLKFPWGAYHYYKINKDPIRQAEHFCAHLRTDSGLPPVLDIEAINNERYQFPKDTENLLKFLDFVENFTAQVPMIYSNYYFLRDKIQPDKRFEKYPLWIAWYTNDFNRVKVPKPWDRITLWQYTDRALIDGVKGSVDANKVI